MRETSQRQSSRTIVVTAVIFAIASLVVGGIVMFDNRHSSAITARTTFSSSTEQPVITPTVGANPAEPVAATPGSSQSNVSNTTVTVNGETTHVSGSDGITAYNKTYTTGDGANVSISVHNHSSSSSSSEGGAVQ